MEHILSALKAHQKQVEAVERKRAEISSRIDALQAAAVSPVAPVSGDETASSSSSSSQQQLVSADLEVKNESAREAELKDLEASLRMVDEELNFLQSQTAALQPEVVVGESLYRVLADEVTKKRAIHKFESLDKLVGHSGSSYLGFHSSKAESDEGLKKENSGEYLLDHEPVLNSDLLMSPSLRNDQEFLTQIAMNHLEKVVVMQNQSNEKNRKQIKSSRLQVKAGAEWMFSPLSIDQNLPQSGSTQTPQTIHERIQSLINTRMPPPTPPVASPSPLPPTSPKAKNIPFIPLATPSDFLAGNFFMQPPMTFDNMMLTGSIPFSPNLFDSLPFHPSFAANIPMSPFAFPVTMPDIPLTVASGSVSNLSQDRKKPINKTKIDSKNDYNTDSSKSKDSTNKNKK
eukprot:GDKJ01042693.1.p1 GENE.GDKJ01042693.1~~GDKJ01042693.1.p1  ORF type:complete len:465 (-),score=139.18 GDKJ01042693.1:249-1451(-)